MRLTRVHIRPRIIVGSGNTASFSLGRVRALWRNKPWWGTNAWKRRDFSFFRRSTNLSLPATAGGMGAGMALMYLLDPAHGRRRRGLVRDRLNAALHSSY